MSDHSTPPLHPLSANGVDLKDPDVALDFFMEYVTRQGLDLYPAQEEAILQLFSGENVVLTTPTGSGKSLVAMAMHFWSLVRYRRSVYTCPIKALVNEKFLNLCSVFGAENVGLITGDAKVNSDAPIICCTAEILMNEALRLGEQTDFVDVIMDEFHYYGDEERGVAWQVPLLLLRQARFLLMSATMGDPHFFVEKLTELTGSPTNIVSSLDRPVPLEFQYAEKPLEDFVREIGRAGKTPVYVVAFTQRECADNAQSFLSSMVLTKEERTEIASILKGVHFSSPYGKDMKRYLSAGIGLHHAGLLPKYRILVEKLAQKGFLKVICGTDTLGVGVNVPIRSVLFTKLCKFNGQKTALLQAREFHQIAGRAGRRGYDSQGSVFCMAPAHVIENKKLEQKAALNPKLKKKMVKAKPPTKGYVPWNEETFQKLIAADPERLRSKFTINHSMIIQILSRPGDGCQSLKEIVRSSHETPAMKVRLRKRTFQLFRALRDGGI
ncbi:MAG: DUF3516 domain-containing protein, partial [Zetaproteobacteria bacterium]|nr:DUF3516 domain-containing protein [Zetaproteobacteria bacterium]